MPELPEVETIRLGLQKYVIGHTITDIQIRLPRMFSGEVRDIIGAKIKEIRRFGKGLVIDLDNGFSIAVHVKMTGQLIYKEIEETKGTKETNGLLGRHTHVVFKLKSQNSKVKTTIQNSKFQNSNLYYNDVRQFGWLRIVKTNEILKLPFFSSLGLEPLKNLTLEDFSKILKSSKTAIKKLLMDQRKIAGIGNIYANDALFIAKIHPKRPASSLSSGETKKLFKAIEDVLQKGIEAGGASEWNYVNVLGGKGKYQNYFQVYQKDGKKCKNCGTAIQKIKLGGRGTFFCPACQAL